MIIKVRYHDPNMPPLEFYGGTDKSNWIDLRCMNEELLSVGEYKLISLGVSMELPEGYEAIVIPRSSTFKRYGIIQANSVGLIDNSYKGENDIWYMPVYATRMALIPKYERICQFRIQPVMKDIELVTVEQLTGNDRGGIGSTNE